MNRDGAIRVLKLHQEWRMGREPYDKAGCPMPHSPKGLTAALDYAIAYMRGERGAENGGGAHGEPKPTQFDERVAKLNKQYGYPFEPMPYRMMASYIASRNNVAEMLTLISDMQAHIQKLEKGQSDGTSGK